MEHKEEKLSKESIATASSATGESKNATQVLDKISESKESKGVLGSVWSATKALTETVQHAVAGMTGTISYHIQQAKLNHGSKHIILGTIDAAYQTAEKIQHDAGAVSTVGGYVAHKVAEKANSVIENVVDATKSATAPAPPEPKPIEMFLSSPTSMNTRSSFDITNSL